jgi:uncharacterized protein (TIGR03086 family)
MVDVTKLTAAQSAIRTRVATIGAGHWDLPTPCTDWTVTDLVTHLVEGSHMAVMLLQGASADQSRSAFGVTHGPDLGAELDVALNDELAAFGAAGAFETIVHHPAAGDIPGATMYGFRTGDYLLHGWDIARAIGDDERLPEELVVSIWDDLQPMAAVIGQIGVFGTGPSGTIADDAPLQLRLLDLTGRRP